MSKVVDNKVTIHLNTTTDEVVADDTGTVTHVLATKDGSQVKLDVDGVFVFVGLKPNTEFLADSGIECDERIEKRGCINQIVRRCK